MKKCSACGNVSKDEVMQCPYCGSNNFVPENAPQPMQQVPGQPMGVQPMPGYPMGQMPTQPMPGPMQGQTMQGQPMPQQPMGVQPMPGYQMGQMPGPGVPQASQDKGNIAWGILGFFIPIVGWILYFVWKNTKPGDAKMAGLGGIIGFCFNMFIQVFIFG